MKVMNGLDLQSQKIANLADPSVNTDAANKQYVDNVARGLMWKAPVRVATTTAGTLVSAFANGQSIDGVILATGDRVLIKDQAAGAENGLYTVNASGAPSRALDADTNGELAPGTAVSVTAGTTNADKLFMMISDAAITIGTTAQTWGSLSGGGASYTAGNGIGIAGSVISAVAAGSGGVQVVAGGIQLDASIAARKFSSTIGNGAATVISVTHGLGTKDVHVSVRAVADDSHVIADFISVDINTVSVTFAAAPASNAYRVTVIG